MPSAARIADEAFWEQPTLEVVEQLRLDIRNLLVYIKDDKKAIVTLHIDDTVQIRPSFGGMLDIKTYREKVITTSTRTSIRR